METQTGKEGVLGLQDLKKYMQKVNHKIPTATLREKFTKYDRNYVNEIGFDDFCSILQEVRKVHSNYLILKMWNNICWFQLIVNTSNALLNYIFQVLFHRPLFKDLFNEFTSDGKRVSLYEFQKFLAKEQGNVHPCSHFMKNITTFVHLLDIPKVSS